MTTSVEKLITPKHHLFKDYFLMGGVLVKVNMNDSKHLLWSKGGVPCIDANLWDSYKDKITKIYFKTRKGKIFKTTKETFEENKKFIDFGFGGQYYINLEYYG